MLIPKKNRRVIHQQLFQEGVLVAKKDFHCQHPDIDVPNLQVIKAMQSMTSRGLVRTLFSWQYYYYFLTNEGIEFLRQELHLPLEIVPRTFIKTQKRGTFLFIHTLVFLTLIILDERPQQHRKKEGASGDFKPDFRGGLGRGRRE